MRGHDRGIEQRERIGGGRDDEKAPSPDREIGPIGVGTALVSRGLGPHAVRNPIENLGPHHVGGTDHQPLQRRKDEENVGFSPTKKLKTSHTPAAAKEETKEVDEEILHMRKILKTELVDLDLSVRALNCLKAADIRSLADLVSYDVADMLKFRNFGKKSLTEIQDLVKSKGLSFGMNLSKFKLDED